MSIDPHGRHRAPYTTDTHGVTVDVSRICIRPTTGSLTSLCSSSEPRGQRGSHRHGDQLARRMLQRDEIGMAASLLRRRGRCAASPLALEAVCLARPTTPAIHHRQRRRSCNAAPRGDGLGSARSAANEAPAAARVYHGPSSVRRADAIDSHVSARDSASASMTKRLCSSRAIRVGGRVGGGASEGVQNPSSQRPIGRSDGTGQWTAWLGPLGRSEYVTPWHPCPHMTF